MQGPVSWAHAPVRPQLAGFEGHPMKSDDLKDAGLKATLPRLKILSILEQNQERHMSAEDVYQALVAASDNLGHATIYRVLMQLESAGFVIRHQFAEGHAVYELDQGEHHDHIVCTDCGKVTEFTDTTIERLQTKIAEENGFRLTDHSLLLRGHCVREGCVHRKH